MPDFLAAVRPDPGWLPRASVGLGVGATIAMNVAAGSRGGLGGALLGTLPPVGFVISLETLIWLVRKLARLPYGWEWCAGAGIPLAGLAGITGVISYLHALTVAQWTGNPAEAGLALTEHLLPLVADLMIVTGSVALVALAVAAKTPAAVTPAAVTPAAKPGIPAGAGREASGASRSQLPREGPAPRQPARQRKSARPESASQFRVVRVRDLVTELPPARVAELAAMSKRDLAAELSVTPWAAEVWLRERRLGQHDELAVNGSASGKAAANG